MNLSVGIRYFSAIILSCTKLKLSLNFNTSSIFFLLIREVKISLHIKKNVNVNDISNLWFNFTFQQYMV